uniref:SFRICE_028567 n=1 Tax=Spodoptera frugiperda TaxID=7108 RepID=A0A2H1WK19_SPOFR
MADRANVKVEAHGWSEGARRIRLCMKHVPAGYPLVLCIISLIGMLLVITFFITAMIQICDELSRDYASNRAEVSPDGLISIVKSVSVKKLSSVKIFQQ